MKEQWRIVSVNGSYEVSDRGNVRRLDSGLILSVRPRRNGYINVSLVSPKGVQKRFYVHRLVAMEFCGGIPCGMEVNHLNFCKHDNRAKNLEVVTRLENAAHSKRAGQYNNNGKNSPRGEQSPHSKLTLKDVRALKKLSAKGMRGDALANLFQISRRQARNIILGRSWANAV